MTTITLFSAKGSPGVTTTTVALALALPAQSGLDVVVFDADPAGGDMAAGFLRGAVPPAGALTLAGHHAGDPWEALADSSVPVDDQSRVRIVTGVPDEARAGALPLAWDILRSAQGSDEFVLLVDAGRVSSVGTRSPWLLEADLGVLVARPTVRSVAAAQRLVACWPQPRPTLQLALVDEASPYSPTECARAVGVPLLTCLPNDRRAAAFYSDGAAARRDQDRSPLVHCAAAAAKALGSRPGEFAT